MSSDLGARAEQLLKLAAEFGFAAGAAYKLAHPAEALELARLFESRAGEAVVRIRIAPSQCVELFYAADGNEYLVASVPLVERASRVVN